jgi:sirohydrochlorin cobaltochelatase
MESEVMNADGLLLFAHGARDPAWAAPFQAIAAELQQRQPTLPLALAYLELMTPDLPAAAGTLVALGCKRIQIVPMFLGSSGHVRRDVPPLVEDLRRQHPGVLFLLHDAIGEQPSVIQAMASATLELVSAVPPLPGAQLTAPQEPAAASLPHQP